MTDIDLTLTRIRTVLRRHGRKAKVVKATGIRPATLTLLMQPTSSPRAKTISRVEGAVITIFPREWDETHPSQ